ncbi:MAG: hypothetical protein IJE66_03340 [Akkermansia sp.]|nr:hypothetical protein [Akkermansia sp.]
MMKKVLLLVLALFVLTLTPAMATETPAQLAVKARANVIACALEILSLENAEKYPEVLAKGINKQVTQLEQVEDIIDDLDEDAVLEAENRLANSANFARLAADYRQVMRALESKAYYDCETLKDALEDLEDVIEDME